MVFLALCCLSAHLLYCHLQQVHIAQLLSYGAQCSDGRFFGLINKFYLCICKVTVCGINRLLLQNHKIQLHG